MSLLASSEMFLPQLAVSVVSAPRAPPRPATLPSPARFLAPRLLRRPASRRGFTTTTGANMITVLGQNGSTAVTLSGNESWSRLLSFLFLIFHVFYFFHFFIFSCFF